MELMNLWEMQLPIKKLYSACIEPVCKSHRLTRTELDILLFLANNPMYDTAADIVNIRLLAKSHVSSSINSLEKHGLLTKSTEPKDKRIIHLSLTSKSKEPVSAGQKAQKKFFSILCGGMSKEDIKKIAVYFTQMKYNIKNYLEANEL